MSLSAREELAGLVSKAKALVGEVAKRAAQGVVRLDRPVQNRPVKAKVLEMRPSKAVVASPDPKPPWQGQLWDFKAQIAACRRCGLSATRKNFVFGEGSKDADLMFVGEAPGADEDVQGRPFVGKAGQLLERIIQAMGFRREHVFIANLLKCRPPRNRDPFPDEIDTCRPYVEHQIELIKPKVIVALGRFAAQTLLRTETGITRLRGHWTQHRGIAVMPTFHPSALLRDQRLKRPVWEDMKLVMKKLGELEN